MFEELLPKKKIGYLYPRHIVDVLPYELYRLFPDRVMIVFCPLSLKGFNTEDVDRALAPLDQYLAKLVDRDVDIIVHGGVPLCLFKGLEHHDDLLMKINKTTGLPATSTILAIISSAKSLGIEKLAVANKWSPDMNKALSLYFEREGIRIVGANCRAMELDEFLKLKFEDHTALIYELARGAIKDNPDADGLYIGGGSMVSYPIVENLEKEFGKPVITTTNALSWGLCHQLDCWEPVHGFGRLLESM